ncbi:MAG: MarR family winged helix-turn-helix transcriptional regulator [Candidatus Hermodarchaeota archaeon]
MKRQREGGLLIAKIHYLGQRIFNKILKENQIEINSAQGRIMFVLWRNEAISIKELAKKTSLGKSTLTSMLDRLENIDYIRRVPSKTDRRKILIELTEKNRQLNNNFVKVSQEMNNIFYRGFTDNEIDSFEEYLSRIFRNLTEYNIK